MRVIRVVEVWRCRHCTETARIYLSGARGPRTRRQAVRAGWQVLPGYLSLRRRWPRLHLRVTCNKFDRYNCPQHRSKA